MKAFRLDDNVYFIEILPIDRIFIISVPVYLKCDVLVNVRTDYTTDINHLLQRKIRYCVIEDKLNQVLNKVLDNNNPE
jgi:hypothetical protein